MIARVVLSALAALFVTGCGRDSLLRCENPETYRGSGERAPIQVPDDLSVPNESDALRIPPGERLAVFEDEDEDDEPVAAPCLELPPDYYEGLGEAGAAPAQD
jgi:uncharacterized lipoprotein